MAGAAGIKVLTGGLYGSVYDNRHLAWVVLTTSEVTLQLCGMAFCLLTLFQAFYGEHGPPVLGAEAP